MSKPNLKLKLKLKLDEYLADEAATVAMGGRLCALLPGSATVFLHGDLGAGKTTLVRGLLRVLGYQGAVKSPTYTLLEPYEIVEPAIYHFDFYRIMDPQELDFIGVAEIFSSPGLKLVEWPERALEKLPSPDLEIYLSVEGRGRRLRTT